MDENKHPFYDRCRLRAASSNGTSASGHDNGEYDYDLFTIGAGSGGTRATRFAATYYGNAFCFLSLHLILCIVTYA